jgi:hypothetical protein
MSATGRLRAPQFGPLVMALVLVSYSAAHAGELVTDETLKLQVLRLTFPNTQISVIPANANETPYSVTDPLGRVVELAEPLLAPNHDYEIVGSVAKYEEEPASDITDLNRPPSDKRQVRMQLFRWRIANGGPLLLEVLSYSFANANPARCCRALGKILLLSSTGDHILDTLDTVPYAFTMFTSVEFFQVDGTDAEKVMIGGDFSGVATVGVNSVVLDVSHQRLTPLMSVTTGVLYEEELENTDVHTLVLDERRTRAAGGKRFFFIKKSYVEKGKIRRTPVSSVVSYPIGTGLPLDWH